MITLMTLNLPFSTVFFQDLPERDNERDWGIQHQGIAQEYMGAETGVPPLPVYGGGEG